MDVFIKTILTIGDEMIDPYQTYLISLESGEKVKFFIGSNNDISFPTFGITIKNENLEDFFGCFKITEITKID